MRRSKGIVAIGRMAVIIMIIVIVIVAAAAAVYLSSQSTTTGNTTSSSSTSSSVSYSSTPISTVSNTSLSQSVSSSLSSIASSTTSSYSPSSSSLMTATSNSTSPTSSSVSLQTLSIDEALYPAAGFAVYSPAYSFPVWWEYDVYQTLVNYDVKTEYSSGGYYFLPALADNWTVSPDGMTWSFNIRPNVTFSNGDPFNAYQAWLIFYTQYYMGGNTTVFYAYNTILNTTNVQFGRQTVQILNESGLINPNPQALAILQNSSWPIYAPTQYQLVFHLTRPFLYLLNILAGLDGLMFDGQFFLNHGGPAPFGAPSLDYFANNPTPGTGPYYIANYSYNAYIWFKQYPRYWGNALNPSVISANELLDPGHVKNVIIYYKPDDIARYTDLASGTVQIATVTSEDWNLISSNPSKYSWISFPSWANILFSVAFNVEAYPTNNTDFRLAIAHAINYSAINQTIFGGTLHSFFGPMTPGEIGYYDLGNYSQYSYNLTLAQQYLNESGITNPPTIQFVMPSGFTSLTGTSQIIQADLAQIGININIEVESYNQWISPYTEPYSQRYGNASQFAQMTFFGGQSFGMNDEGPAENWVSYASAAGYNFGLYNTTLSEQVAQEFWSTDNLTQIQSLLAQGQQQIYEQAPYLWLGTFSLVLGDGSVAWNNHIVSGSSFDPMWSGGDTTVLFNTVTFV